MKQKKGKRSKWWLMLGLCCFVVFCVSAYMVTTQLIDEKKSADAFAGLRSQISEEVPADESTAADSTEKDSVSDTEQTAQDSQANTSKYASLAAQNPDFFGWIKIDGTTVDYPVMHTPDDPEYYLRRAFDGSDSNSGTPFLAGECYLNDKNYIVYGHHMINGTMFADITEYAEQDFWKEHPIIHFDTLEKEGDYEVIAAFPTQVYDDDQADAFRYYAYTDLTTEQLFNEFINGVESAKLYNTGVKAQFGDQLLTLSTCSYHNDDGRFVVVAREIS